MATPTPPTLDPTPGFSGPRRLDGSFDALLDYLWVTERKNIIRRKIPRGKRPRVKAHRRLEMRLKASFKNYPFEEDASNPVPRHNGSHARTNQTGDLPPVMTNRIDRYNFKGDQDE